MKNIVLFFSILILFNLSGCHLTEMVNENVKAAPPSQEHYHSFKEIKLGYYTQYAKNDHVAYDSLKENGSNFNTLSIDNYRIDLKGKITSKFNLSKVFVETKKYHMNTMALIGNVGFSQAKTHQLLSNTSAINDLINNSLKLVKGNNMNGLNIDFENLMPDDRGNYSNFLRKLYSTFHKEGYLVVVSVPAKSNDSRMNKWTYPFDYQAIGQSSDVVQMMTYDLHGPWSHPGSIASSNWMQQTVTYALSKIPKNKIIIGLPTYAYDWNLDTQKAHGLAMSQIASLLSKYHAKEEWDHKTESAFVYYKDSQKNKHVVWFENAKSLRIKSNYVTKYHLKGLSFWRLGTESKNFWNII